MSTVAAVDVERDLAVLGALLLDDVELGEDLDPADETRRQVRGQFGDLAQDAVDAGTDPQAGRVRLEVQVAGPVAQGLGDEQVDDLDDRRVLEAWSRGAAVRVAIRCATTGRLLVKAVTWAARSPTR